MSHWDWYQNGRENFMHTAEVLGETPEPISTTSLDPYGQLIKMLMPRAQSIAIYDRMGLTVWLSDGQDVPELHRLMQDSLAQDLAPGQDDEGLAEATDQDHCAYGFLLRNKDGGLLGAVGLISRESSSGQFRPFSLVQGLLRPALEELEIVTFVVLEHESEVFEVEDLENRIFARWSAKMPF